MRSFDRESSSATRRAKHAAADQDGELQLHYSFYSSIAAVQRNESYRPARQPDFFEIGPRLFAAAAIGWLVGDGR